MRLTINTNSDYGYELKADNPNTSLAQDTVDAIQKLGQVEDIEEELGIDLITLFKALKQGYIWYDEEKYKIECLYMKPRIHLYVADGVGGCYMENYGKTWALTKEELF